MSLPAKSARELIVELERLKGDSQASALAFDADGTLWSGDVSEDVFSRAVADGLIKSDAADALARTAAEAGIATDGTVSDIAAHVFAAYREGRYPEREVCEMMTWCYAGWSPRELAEYARVVLEAANLGARLNRGLEPILDWARAAGVKTVVVSASPRLIVEVAASLWHFAASDIAASDAELEGGRIAARMNGQVPYGPAKCPAARAVMNDADWLASFGDNVYDIEMMRAARLGIAVNPKPILRKRLPELPFVVLLA
jgi:phosphoserine phosphatase